MFITSCSDLFQTSLLVFLFCNFAAEFIEGDNLWSSLCFWMKTLGVPIMAVKAVHSSHSVTMYNQSGLTPQLDCFVNEVRESIKVTKRAKSLLRLKTGCKIR